MVPKPLKNFKSVEILLRFVNNKYDTVQLEEAMEPYLKGTDLGLPYWDWTTNAELPDVWADIYPEIKSFWSNSRKSSVSGDYWDTNHVKDMKKGICHNDKGLSAVSRINKREFSANDLLVKQKNAIKTAHEHSDFIKFSAAANDAHGNIHLELKCSMPAPATTAYDPTFWMHHTFLDKVLADRQANEANTAKVRV